MNLRLTIYLLAFLFFAERSYAPVTLGGKTTLAGKATFASTSSPTYLFQENFEGTGYENTWTETVGSGTIDEDYTATVLEGAQSLYLNSPATTTRTTTILGASYDELYFYFLLRPVSVGVLGQIGNCLSSVNTAKITVYLNANQTIGVKSTGGTQVNTISTVSAGTTYHVWLHAKKGTGSDALATVAFSTTATEPTSGNGFASSSNGTWTDTGLNKFQLSSSTSGTLECIFDKCRIAQASIGNSPP